jgi:hypothetical protein
VCCCAEHVRGQSTAAAQRCKTADRLGGAAWLLLRLLLRLLLPLLLMLGWQLLIETAVLAYRQQLVGR